MKHDRCSSLAIIKSQILIHTCAHLAWEYIWHFWCRYYWFPCQMTSEKQAQKFHTDDASLPRSGSVLLTRHKYGISAFISQTSFGGETRAPNVGCFLRLLHAHLIFGSWSVGYMLIAHQKSWHMRGNWTAILINFLERISVYTVHACM